MSVIDRLRKQERKLPLSVEIEPPKIGYPRADVFELLDPLVELGIKWVDITYHVARVVDIVEHNGGTHPIYQRLHPGTAGIAGAISERYSKEGVFPVPHVICTGFSAYDTEDFLHGLACLGIFNILALRGDGAFDEEGNRLPFECAPGGYFHATGLISQVQDLKKGKYLGAKTGQSIDFSIGAACYPEKHEEMESVEEDIYWTKVKADSGVDYFVTQMFFDAEVYKVFVDRARAAGIEQPIIPGIKPLTIYKHLSILPKIFGCHIPKELRERVEKHKESKEDIRKVGVEWCVEQCHKLEEYGAPSLHFYAARKAPIKQIIEAL